MGTWLNNDGLLVRFHRSEGDLSKTGEYNTLGPTRVIETKIDLATLPTGSTILDDYVTVPRGARIEYIEVLTDVAATSGGTSNLNFGVVRTDRSTTYDADGFLASFALSNINAVGKYTKVVVGSTGAGTLVGTTLAYAGLLVADVDTAVFTAGTIRVRVGFYIP